MGWNVTPMRGINRIRVQAGSTLGVYRLIYVSPSTVIAKFFLLRELLGSPPNSRCLAPDPGPVCSIGGYSLRAKHPTRKVELYRRALS